MQSEGYPGMLHALGRGPAPTDGPTIAEGIAVAEPGLLTRTIVGELVDEIVIVTEAATSKKRSRSTSRSRSRWSRAPARPPRRGARVPRRRSAAEPVALIASGGNIDARVLTSVLSRALARSGRLVRLLIDVPDRPGVLAVIAAVVARETGNIVDVEHRRDLPGVALKSARLELSIETRDRSHADEIVRTLAAAGLHVEVA